MQRRSIASAAALFALIGCFSGNRTSEAQTQGAVKPLPTATTFARYQHHFFPATEAQGRPSSSLSVEQQDLVASVQRVLKPTLRSTLMYTYSATGTFVLVLRDDQFVINYCHTPNDHSHCMHDCGVALNPQTWEATAITDFGRCQDEAPVWLAPKAPLPPFPTS